MRVVHKFHLEIGETILSIPANAEIVHVAEQIGELQMWVELNPSAPKINRFFRVFCTGHPIDDIQDQLGFTLRPKYVGTALMAGSAFVAHIYEAIII